MSSETDGALVARAEVLFRQHRQRLYARTDRLFAGLMLFQWAAAIAAAYVVSPLTWEGPVSRTHVHVWAAIFLGGAITLFPVMLGLLRSGHASTRHTIAVSQMLMSALLIHLTGGRIETHFHVFGSLAFLGFYRDWKIFVPATLIVAADHFLRGAYWPESVYGVTSAPWRWVEHAGWVIFEDVFLVDACLQSVREMRGIAHQQAQLELVNEQTERTVRARTVELRASEDVFRSLSAASPTGIFRTDAQGRVTYFNARWAEIVGRAPSDGLGDGWMRCVHPEDLPTVLRNRDSALRERRETVAEFRAVRPDGEVRWVQVRTKPMLADGTASVGHVGTVEDITVRKHADAAREEHARTSAALARIGQDLLSSLETPVLLERLCQLTATVLSADYSNTWLRQDGTNQYVPVAGYGLRNDQWDALRTIRLNPEEFVALLGRLGRGMVVELTPASVSHPILAGLLARHGARMVACIPLHRGGDLIGIQVAAYRDSATAFTPERAGIAHGISQLASTALTNARLVEEIAEASRLKSEFVSTMSHELRTPLNVIIGYTEMLADEECQDQRARLLGQIRQSSVELLDMVVATLDLSRIAAGKDDPHFQTVPLGAVWADLIADFAAFPRPSGVTLRWSDPGELALHSDRRKLKAILKNLIENALKFTPAGEVSVECPAKDDLCTLRVRDTGIGIAPADLPFIFDMFRQVDGSETRSYGGAGLGLYIVHTLITQLGGRIEVDSEIGRGTLFQLTLPLARSDHATQAEQLAVAS